MTTDETPSHAPGRTALCPGSYDPVTFGHLDVIRRASPLFDRIVVGVVRLPKHKTPFFDVEERIGFIRESTADIPNGKNHSGSKDAAPTLTE